MTDEERYLIQGRARDALKKAKETAATLRADIAEHAMKLKDAAECLTAALADPVKCGPTGMSQAQYFMHFYQPFVTAEIAAKLQHLEREALRVKELEKQVAEF